jgi:methionyl-tRNA synthetase
VARNNNELVATWGNLANRVLSFAYKHWDGQIPTPNELRPADREILSKIDTGVASVGTQLDAVKLRSALGEAMRLASEVNKYLDTAGPWFEIKTDKAAAGTTIYTALKAIDTLKVLFAPFLPFTCEKLHHFLGYTMPLFGEQFTEKQTDALGEHNVLRYNPAPATGKWQPSQLQPGQKLNPPAPLFKKLEESVAEIERGRLGK